MKIIGSCAILSPDMRDRCIDAGMNAVVEKPLDIKKLSSSIAHLFPEVRDSNDQSNPVDDNEVIALSILKDHCETLGIEEVCSLYEEAEISAKNLVEKICLASPHEYPIIKSSAHALAGLCSNFGFLALGECAKQLQKKQINIESDTAQLQFDLNQLSKCCETTFLYLPDVISRL